MHGILVSNIEGLTVVFGGQLGCGFFRFFELNILFLSLVGLVLNAVIKGEVVISTIVSIVLILILLLVLVLILLILVLILLLVLILVMLLESG